LNSGSKETASAFEKAADVQAVARKHGVHGKGRKVPGGFGPEADAFSVNYGEGRVCVQGRDGIGHVVTSYHVIGIQEEDVLPFRKLQALVPGGGDALVLVEDNRDEALVGGAEVGHDKAGLVGGTVVYDEAFPVLKGLRANAVKGIGQILSKIVAGNYDAYFRHK